ncbi:MAG TPA: hypothetical protein VFI42_16060 [Thermomicrobiaceae bacterium]|nr:hypothetical protein [Thermomicrobiaceae bacterium]
MLAEADQAPIELERDGERYRLSRIKTVVAEDIWAGYDPEAALAGMRAAAGSWSNVDVDALKDQIYRARDEGSRPLDCP